MNVLVACEFSGVVRDAFTAHGHSAMSVDFLPSERPGFHMQADVYDCLNMGWDLMLAFPPCTHLASSGARWFYRKKQEQADAVRFCRHLLNAPINHICLENPIGVLSTKMRKPDQIIQPWEFGHAETKATCLWLKNLPKLKPTKIIRHNIKARVHLEPPSPDRWKNRSRTLLGIANAMAEQWGGSPKPAEPKVTSCEHDIFLEESGYHVCRKCQMICEKTPVKPDIFLADGEFHKCPTCGIMKYVTVTVRNHPNPGDRFFRCVFCGGLLGAGSDISDCRIDSFERKGDEKK